MKRHVIRVEQKLVGFIEIIADNHHAALEIADKRLNKDGEELSKACEMEDCEPLEFFIQELDCDDCGELTSYDGSASVVRGEVPDENTSSGSRNVFECVCLKCFDDYAACTQCGYSFHHIKLIDNHCSNCLKQ